MTTKQSGAGCGLSEPHDCASVRQANDALRRHLDRACESREALRSALRDLLDELRRRDGEGNLLPDNLPAMSAAIHAVDAA